MLRTKRPGFSPVDVFVVHPSRDLKFNGKTYQRETIFPWKEAGCTARRLRLLFQSRKVISQLEVEGDPKKTVILQDEVFQDEKQSAELAVPKNEGAPKRRKRRSKVVNDDTHTKKWILFDRGGKSKPLGHNLRRQR